MAARFYDASGQRLHDDMHGDVDDATGRCTRPTRTRWITRPCLNRDGGRLRVSRTCASTSDRRSRSPAHSERLARQRTRSDHAVDQSFKVVAKTCSQEGR